MIREETGTRAACPLFISIKQLQPETVGYSRFSSAVQLSGCTRYLTIFVISANKSGAPTTISASLSRTRVTPW